MPAPPAVLLCVELWYTKPSSHSTSYIDQQRSIFELEALNAAMVVKLWAPTLVNRRVRLYIDSSMAVAILQAGKGRKPYSESLSC